MDGNPFPYRKVPVVYIPQCQLEMYATNRSKCHFVCWTPKRTLVYLIKRDDKFIDELVTQLKKFWHGAISGNIPKSNPACDNLKTAAEKISDNAKLLRTITSCRKENATEHENFNNFLKQKESIPKRKCVGCGKLQVVCKLNSCQQQKTNELKWCQQQKTVLQQTLQSYQSFTYGSGQVLNSCHTDTFLEAIYHPFIRQVTPSTVQFSNPSQAMDALLDSIIFREQGHFHKGKMRLWKFLQNHTTNGHVNFALGQIAAISQIFDTLCSNLNNDEKKALFMVHSSTFQCSVNPNHAHTRYTIKSLFFIHNSFITIKDISNSSYDPVQLLENLLTQKDTASPHRCLQKAQDTHNICDGTLLSKSDISNDPLFIPVELDKDENRPVQPKLSSKLEIYAGDRMYVLTAIIYHHNAHFWCEKLVTGAKYKEGWYSYNDMENSGKAQYIGKNPQVKNPAYMHILLFEKNINHNKKRKQQTCSQGSQPKRVKDHL